MSSEINANPIETTYETIFNLLRSCLWGHDIFPFNAADDTDWLNIYKELAQQAIPLLPTDLLCQIDSAHGLQYLYTANQGMTHWYIVMRSQQHLCNLLKSAKIPFAILKGASAASYYPKPDYRSMGDIDFIVKSEDFDKTCQLLEKHGYETSGIEHYRHIDFTKNDVPFELHRCFSTFNNSDYARIMDNMIFDGLVSAHEITLEDFSFPVLPPLENGLVLLTHINQHLETGLGLRQIIDWMLYVSKELDDNKWYSQFAPIAQQLGLETLAVTVTRMCQIYLGLSSSINWCKKANDNLCEQLMLHIIEYGNFGKKKDLNSKRTITIISTFRNFSALLRRLQYRGCVNWKLLNKFPVLKPFAWLYQLFRYICLGLKRKHPLKELWIDIKKSRQQEDFLNQLGVSREKNGKATAKEKLY